MPREQLGFNLTGDTKACYACGRVQPVECFAKLINKGVEYRNRRCNACRHRRQEGSSLVKEKMALIAAEKTKPCTDCGRSWPTTCMDFDHVRGAKVFNIGSSVRWKSLPMLREEIAKCDVVCACCHRLRTEKRRPFSKYRVGRPPKYVLAEVPRAPAPTELIVRTKPNR